jgi:hypothetical protein
MISAGTSNITLLCIKCPYALSIPGNSTIVLYGPSNHVKHTRNVLVYSETASSVWNDVFSVVTLTNSVIMILMKQVRSLCAAVWTDAFRLKKVIKSPVLP